MNITRKQSMRVLSECIGRIIRMYSDCVNRMYTKSVIRIYNKAVLLECIVNQC